MCQQARELAKHGSGVYAITQTRPEVPDSVYTGSQTSSGQALRNDSAMGVWPTKAPDSDLPDDILYYFLFWCWPVLGRFPAECGLETPVQLVGLETRCRTPRKLAPETNYKAISWLIPGLSHKVKCKMAA